MTSRVLPASKTIAALIACCGLSVSAFAQDGNPKDAPAPAPQKAPQAAGKDGKRLIVGEAAPALSVEKWIKGDSITGFEKGKVYVVEFWATWCGPCKASMPHITELQHDYKGKVTFVGVASPAWEHPAKASDKADDKPKTQLDIVEDMVKEKADEMGYTVAWDKAVVTDDKDKDGKPVILGATDSAYMKAAKQSGIPRAFVVDGKGNLAWVGHPMELDYVLDDIVGGKWDYKESPIKIKEMKDEAGKILEDADGNPKEAVKAIEAFETKYPKMAPRLLSAKYEILFTAGNYADAFKTGEKVVDQAIQHKDQMSLNRIAWGIVDPEGALKAKDKQAGLPLAMRAAAAAVEITKEKDGAILDTLARCYWIKGDKPRAVELQKKAISVVPKDDPENMAQQLKDTLKEYEGGAG